VYDIAGDGITGTGLAGDAIPSAGLEYDMAGDAIPRAGLVYDIAGDGIGFVYEIAGDDIPDPAGLLARWTGRCDGEL
jgi:hypothetical protein